MTNTTMPTDAELLELADICEIRVVLRNGLVHETELLDFARAVLAKWGNQASADSVQEDAARYRWLRINAIGAYRTNNGNGPVSVYHLSKIPAIPGIPEETDAAIDAARKQGEKQ